MVVGQHFNWRNVALSLALITGSAGGALIAEAWLNAPQIAVAQPTETPTDSGFLQGLLQLNQDFLTAQPQFRRLPTELEALDRRSKTFEAKVFQDHSAAVKKLQQQLASLETQLGSFSDEQQQLEIKTSLEKLRTISQNLLKLSESFEAGFNPTSIRKVQEFLNFFERRKLGKESYGFYGTVTQTEMRSYVDQQVTDFAKTLKQLNQTATQAAIAPDLATSINYLYTTVSLENATGNSGATIERLEAENASLQKQIDNTRKIILFLPLIVMLPTTILVFILFYYFGKIVQEKSGKPSNYQFSLNDIYGLEEELVDRLTQKYELKPRLIDRKSNPFTDKLISLANSDFQEEETELDPTPRSHHAAKQPSEKQEKEAIADPDLVMDGLIAEDDEDSFPVQIPNIYDELVDTYNEDANKLEEGAIALSISHQESYLDDDSEFMAMLLLNKDEAGEFWATHYKSLDYLIPKANLSVTVDNYNHFKNVFVCYGYQHNTVQKAKLLKPARVSPAEEEDTWELVQQGIVVLHCI